MSHRIERRDCHSIGGRGFTPTSLRRDGQTSLLVSASTGRHRSGWCALSGERTSAPLARLVKPGLPGGAARLDGVSYVVRTRRPRGTRPHAIHSSMVGKERHPPVNASPWHVNSTIVGCDSHLSRDPHGARHVRALPGRPNHTIDRSPAESFVSSSTSSRTSKSLTTRRCPTE